MKRAVQLILILIVAFVMIPAVTAADLKVIKLVHSGNDPAHIGGNVYLREKWLPKINAELAKVGYKFDYTFYFSESLYKYADQVQALEDGLIDSTTFVLSWEKARAPLHTLISSPLMGFNAQSAQRIWFALQETIPAFGAEFSKYKEIWHMCMIPTVINANKVLRVPADFKGLKVSATGMQADLFKSIGAIPLRLGPPDWYTSLERGLLDVMPLGIYSILVFKLYEVTNTHIFPTADSLSYTGMTYIMNRKKYESFPPEVRKVIDENVKSCSTEQTGIDEINRINAEETIKNMGQTMIYLTPQEMDLWHAAVKPIHEAWIQEMEAKGLPGRQVFDEAKNLARQWAQ
jgi:TRAP-type C4-dicarboxylate transport system substrate-binding protein